jgi:hypothetical protein
MPVIQMPIRLSRKLVWHIFEEQIRPKPSCNGDAAGHSSSFHELKRKRDLALNTGATYADTGPTLDRNFRCVC